MYIKRAKQTQKQNYLLCFDTESLLDKIDEKETIHKPYLICSTFLNRSGERMTYKRKKFYFTDYSNPSEKFYKYVIKLNLKYNNLYVVAHNAKYDTAVTMCIYYLLQNGYEVESVSFANPFFLFFKHTETGAKLSIYSSTNIFQTSLANLGKILGIKKLDFDYFDITPPLNKAITYCNRDVLILAKTMLSFFDSIELIGGIQEKITVASQSFSIFRQLYLRENEIELHKIPSVTELERKSYKGGRTEAFKIGTFKDVYILDINSMYPYIMQNFKSPIKKIFERKFLTKRQLKDLNKKYFVIADCYIENCQEPIFAKQIDNRLCFVKGNFWITLTKPEIEIALEKNLIKYVHNAVVYKEKNIFKDFIKYFYNKRLENKEINIVFANFLKIIMNSLYGKFGQQNIKIEKRGEVADKYEISDFVEMTKDENGKIHRKKIYIFGGHEWAIYAEGDSINAFPCIAGAITAYSRMLLYNYINIAGYENLYYCDTDSLFVTEQGYKNLLQADLVNPDTLGLLKLENICKTITIRNVKDYTYTTYEDKTKDKKKGINLAKAKEIDHNIFEVDYFQGYSDLIHNKNLSEYKTVKRIKKYSEKYNKGIVKSDGVVEHFTLNESEERN